MRLLSSVATKRAIPFYSLRRERSAEELSVFDGPSGLHLLNTSLSRKAMITRECQ